MKILIVERDLSLLETMRDIFHDEGHEIVTSTSCEDARKKIQTEKTPDIIFCDQFIPGNHGHKLRDELSHRKEIRFILMKALAGRHETLRADELAKPFSIEELLKHI